MTSLQRAPRPEPPTHRYIDQEAETREMHQSVRGYRIGSLLGRGESSVVFAVTNPFVPELLAMKVMTDRRLQSDESIDAISTHAKAVAALKSPHVARPIDAGRLPTGEPFVVTAQAKGHDLASSLAEYGPLPEVDARRILSQACEGLAEAHVAGIVHGNLRADRIVLATSESGEAIAVVNGFEPRLGASPDAPDALDVTTLGYLAPEQLGGASAIDARADVWALGVILYELMTGQQPFHGATVAELAAATATTPALLCDTLSPLGEIARRCLAHDRDARFADAAALHEALGTPVPVVGEDAAPPASGVVETAGPPSSIPGPPLSVTQPAQHRLLAAPVVDAQPFVPEFRPYRADLRRLVYLMCIAGAWGFLALSFVRLVKG